MRAAFRKAALKRQVYVVYCLFITDKTKLTKMNQLHAIQKCLRGNHINPFIPPYVSQLMHLFFITMITAGVSLNFLVGNNTIGPVVEL